MANIPILNNYNIVSDRRNWVMIALLIGIFEDTLGGLYYFTRVFFIPNIAHLNKFVTGSVILICFYSLIKTKKVALDGFSLLMIFGLMLGFFNAILYNGSVETSAILSHLMHWLVMFACFTAARSVSWDFERLGRRLKRLVVLALLANGSFFILLDSTRRATGLDVYVGSSAEELLIPFVWFLMGQNFYITALTFLLIIVSGKRGPLIAALGIYTFFKFFKKNRNSFHTGMIKVLFIGSILAFSIGYAFVTYNPTAMLDKGGSIQRAAHKTESSFVRIMEGDGNYEMSLDLATSGRSAEIRSAWGKFTETPLKFIFGSGYGWNIDVRLYDGSSTEKTHLNYHFLHFSPLNIALLYGVIYLLLYYSFVYRIISKSWSNLKKMGSIRYFNNKQKIYTFLLFLLIGKLIVSLTVYNIGVDPVLWIIMGILARPNSIVSLSDKPYSLNC